MNITSAIEADKLLHIIVRKRDIQEGRTNVIPADNFLQLATLRLPKDTTFKAHKHIEQDGQPKVIAQESWYVVKGSVKVWYYDLNDKLLHTDVLSDGDISVTLFGGHNYEIISENSCILEFKSGPYFSQETDKVFI